MQLGSFSPSTERGGGATINPVLSFGCSLDSLRRSWRRGLKIYARAKRLQDTWRCQALRRRTLVAEGLLFLFSLVFLHTVNQLNVA